MADDPIVLGVARLKTAVGIQTTHILRDVPMVEVRTTQEAAEQIALKILRPSGALMVDVMADGTLRYGEDYDPDEAAQSFWKAMADSISQFFTFTTVEESDDD